MAVAEAFRTDCVLAHSMTSPNLEALRLGDAEAWDQAFRFLYPIAVAVARLQLHPFLPGDIEDVAIESVEELVEEFKKAREFKSFDDVRSLTAAIAHNRAVSRLRGHFAQKRGEGKTESLDAPKDDGSASFEPASNDSPLANLEHRELAQRLGKSLAELKPPIGAILSDFFLAGLRYEEIARKHRVATGSVGVYLKRGLEALRRIWRREENS